METTFNMVKGKFDDSVRSKSETGQVNEVLLKFLCHNICMLTQEMHELEIVPSLGEYNAEPECIDMLKSQVRKSSKVGRLYSCATRLRSVC